MLHLGVAMKIIQGWSQDEDGWYANSMQLVLGIHLVQQFIIQHMLVREQPDQWANWWHAEEKDAV